MSCLLCGGKDGPTYVGSGYSNICDECREAFLHYKKTYFVTKSLNETTDLDDVMFEKLCRLMELQETIEGEKNGLFPAKIEPFINDIKTILQRSYKNDEWMNKEPSRLDRFLTYVEKKIREEWDKAT